jgi:hypothetical protein
VVLVPRSSRLLRGHRSLLKQWHFYVLALEKVDGRELRHCIKLCLGELRLCGAETRLHLSERVKTGRRYFVLGARTALTTKNETMGQALSPVLQGREGGLA